MEKKCENCMGKTSTLCSTCINTTKKATNRQWLESLSDKALAVEIQALGDNCCLSDILDWLQAEHKE